MLIFGMLAVTPGDPARTVLAARGVTEPSPPAIAAARAELNLDDPLPVRFVRWAGGALTGDLGLSWRTGRPISADVATVAPATLLLTGVAMALAVVLALVLGVAAGAAPQRWPDTLSRTITFTFIAVPSFVIGVTLLDVLVVRAGLGRIIADGTLATVFLPALVLALSSAAVWSRMLRTSLLEARSAPYVRVVTARGSGPARRLLVHQLPHAAAPFLTVVGLGTGALLGGAPIVETIFTWPGLGRYAVLAINARDMPVVVGFTLIAVLAYVVTSLLADLASAAIDPRLRGRP